SRRITEVSPRLRLPLCLARNSDVSRFGLSMSSFIIRRLTMLVPKGVEEALFKRVVDGWIFSAPNPWTFGRRRSYLVNDAQKADLGMRVRRGRYFRLLALIPMFGLPLATFLLAPSLLRAPSMTTWVLFALFAVVAGVAMNLCDYLPVRPLLVGLPRTME